MDDNIDLLRSLCKKGKCNLTEITWFIDTVKDLFDAKERATSSTKIIDSALDLDVSLIHDLLGRDEENSKTMNHVSTSISNNRKAFEDFETEEAEITAAELALQQRRAEFEARKTSLEEEYSNLNDSLKKHQRLAEEIHQLKNQAGVEKFYEVERARMTLKAQEEEIQTKFDVLTLFLQMV